MTDKGLSVVELQLTACFKMTPRCGLSTAENSTVVFFIFFIFSEPRHQLYCCLATPLEFARVVVVNVSFGVLVATCFVVEMIL